MRRELKERVENQENHIWKKWSITEKTENLKTNQREILEQKSIIPEINLLERFKDRSEQTEESVSFKIGQWKFLSLRNRKKEYLKKTEQSLGDMWDTIKLTNLCIAGDQTRKKRDRKWQGEWRNNGWKLPKFGDRREYKHPGSSVNSK